MNNHPADEQLILAFDNEIDPTAIESHLTECAECRMKWDRLQVIHEFVISTHRAPLPRKRQRWIWEFVAAAAAVAAIAFSLRSLNTPVPIERPFLSLPYSDRALPLDQAMILQVEMPRAALVSAGVPVPVSGDPVAAEVILGIDGLPRAIRLSQ